MSKSKNAVRLKKAGQERLQQLLAKKPEVSLTKEQRQALIERLGATEESIDELLSIEVLPKTPVVRRITAKDFTRASDG